MANWVYITDDIHIATIPNLALINSIAKEIVFFMISKRRNKSERPITCNKERLI